jgi:hypothetical protein
MILCMKLILPLLLIFLSACSSFKEYEMEDYERGRYQFGLLFKKELQKFLADQVLANDGPYIYAGPKFTKYLNYQKIHVISLTPKNTGLSIYRAKDGSQHTFTDYQLNQSHTSPSDYYFDLEISTNALYQYEKTEVRVRVKLNCKKDLECEDGYAINMLKHDSPFDFEWDLMDRDLFTKVRPNIESYNKFEQMAIQERMLFAGMSEAAARLAIGDLEKSFGYFNNIKIENGAVKSFTIREDYARNFYNFY